MYINSLHMFTGSSLHCSGCTVSIPHYKYWFHEFYVEKKLGRGFSHLNLLYNHFICLYYCFQSLKHQTLDKPLYLFSEY